MLRKFVESDLEDAIKLFTNYEVNKMISGVPRSVETATKKFNEMLVYNQTEKETGWYNVSLLASNTFIGLGKIILTNDAEAEIGYAFLPEFWRNSYGTEVSKMLVDKCKKNKELQSLIALIDPDNIASQKILEKCNFNFESNGTWKGLPSATYRLQLH